MLDENVRHVYHNSMILEDGTIRHRRRDINLPGHAHLLTFTCFHRLQLLSKDRTRQWFLDALSKARVKHHFHLWAFVLMPEHVHLLIQPQRYEYKIADIRACIKGSVGRRAMNFLRRHNPEWLERLTIYRPNGDVERHFWQLGGGHDRNIVSNRALFNAILYLHANPVRRGLVANPVDWEWSSARFYEGRDNANVKMEMDTSSLSMLNL